MVLSTEAVWLVNVERHALLQEVRSWSAPARGCFSQPWIKVGWTPNWLARSLAVLSPWRGVRPEPGKAELCRDDSPDGKEGSVRKLASIQVVNAVEPIANADAIERVRVL